MPLPKLPYSKVIANKVSELAKNGVSRARIFQYIADYPNAPKSFTTFYKLYYTDMIKHEVETAAQIGEVIIQKAKEGDYKAAELYLKTKGGWNEKLVIQEDDNTEEKDLSAVELLFSILNKDNEETKANESTSKDT